MGIEEKIKWEDRNWINLYKLFDYMIYVLYTGIQWKMLPIEKGANGLKPILTI
jgi:hypothetical protein